MVKYAVLLNDTSTNRHHGCHLVSRRITQLACQVGINIIARVPVGGDWSADPEIVAAIRNADVVIVNGEGTLHSDKDHALPLVTVATFAAGHGVPTVLINSIWQGNGPRFAEHASAFARLWVRESASRDALATQGLTTVEVVPDLTLSSDPPRPVSQRDSLVITDSNRWDVTAALWDLARRRTDARWLSFLTPPKERLLSHLAWEVFTRIYSGERPRAFKPSVRRTAYTGTERNVEVVLNRLAAAATLITGRFHAVCFAMLTETPFLALSASSHKIEAMLTDIGLAHRLVQTKALVAGINVPPFSSEELLLIRNYRTKAREEARRMFAEIRALS